MSVVVKNQAIKLYDSTETLFNDRTSKCQWHLDYSPLVACTDISELVMDIGVQTADVGTDPEFDFAVVGANTSVFGGFLLRDTGATFQTDNVQVGMTISAAFAGTEFTSWGKVVSIDSETQITSSTSLFNSSTIPYQIGWWEIEGESSIENNAFQVLGNTVSGSALRQTIDIGFLYKVEFTITFIEDDNLGDTLDVSIGGNNVLSLFEGDIQARKYTAFGYSDTDVFEITTGENILITIDSVILSKMDETSFYIKNCDTDAILYTGVDPDFTFSNLFDQLKISIDWSNVDCDGCYYIYVVQGSDNYRTDCFNVSDDLDCTVKLSGTNDGNAFGIDFEGLNYTGLIRVAGELTTPRFDADKENEEDSLGQSQTLYFKSDEKRDLFLYQLPDYHHSFIRLLLGYDTFTIDDVQYISTDGSYSPESERVLGKISDLSNTTTEVRLKDDLNENKFC
jgi:hypothetical protein